VREAVVYGVLASAPLFVGAVIGTVACPSDRTLASILAFAAGAMIAAFTFELVAEADRATSIGLVCVGLAAGAIVFVAADVLETRHAAALGVGGALLVGVLLDGVPENLALGGTITQTTGGVALLVAIAVGNVPEALSGAAEMRTRLSRRYVIAVWGCAAVLTGLAVPIGTLLLDDASGDVRGVILAFAAGAVLAVVSDTALPSAFADGGPWIALATAGGFLVGYVLSVGS
jgi:ZIP family zinc transporter